MLTTYIALYPHDFTIHSVVAIIFGSLATIILWLETARLWRQKPF
jgi:hypothetical protein